MRSTTARSCACFNSFWNLFKFDTLSLHYISLGYLWHIYKYSYFLKCAEQNDILKLRKKEKLDKLESILILLITVHFLSNFAWDLIMRWVVLFFDIYLIMCILFLNYITLAAILNCIKMAYKTVSAPTLVFVILTSKGFLKNV